jgi:hypothetical protein
MLNDEFEVNYLFPQWVTENSSDQFFTMREIRHFSIHCISKIGKRRCPALQLGVAFFKQPAVRTAW